MTRILILQISDIHFLENDSLISSRGPLIAAAVQDLLAISSKTIVAVTGDITQAGKKEEFVVAERFIDSLTSDIGTRQGGAPEVITVPGNHDADFDSPRCRIRTRVLQQLKSESADQIQTEDVEECVTIFDEYHKFRDRVETIPHRIQSPIWQISELEVGTDRLVFHCLNNAWSCEKRTEPGSLGFPLGLHADCAKPSGDLRIVLMHHPAHWLASRQYREFRRFTRECAEVCFTGHEHQANAGANHDAESGLTLYIEGAALQDHGNALSSGFTATIVDLTTRTLETTEFAWDGLIYAAVAEAFQRNLPKKVESVSLQPEWREFLNDIGSNLSTGTPLQVNRLRR